MAGAAPADRLGVVSEENVEKLRLAYDAWNRGDRESWLALGDPDVELILPAVQMMEGGGALLGREGADRAWQMLHEMFTDLRFDVEEIRDLGDRTFAKARFLGRGSGSGAPLDQRVWHLVAWRHGRLIRFQAFLDENEASKAAGLAK